MDSLKIVSLDLFETLVHFNSKAFNSRITLQNVMESQNDLPEMPFDVFYNHYVKIVRAKMSDYETEKEFRNDEVILDIWDKFNVTSGSKLKEKAFSIMEEYFRSVIGLITPFPGVYDTLDFLKNLGLRLILTSNHSWPQNGWEVLRINRLETYFDKIIFSADLRWKKPSPRIFQEVISGFLNVERNQVLHIGDDFRADVIGGLNSGFKTIWINNLSSSLELKDLPSSLNFLGTISEINQLPSFLTTNLEDNFDI